MKMNAQVRDYITRKYGPRPVQLVETHVPLDFGDVVAAMGRVRRTCDVVPCDTFVDSVSIASPHGCERWIVEIEAACGRVVILGSSDFWPVVSTFARRWELEVPILVDRGAALTVTIMSRETRARSVCVQLNGIQTTPREPNR